MSHNELTTTPTAHTKRHLVLGLAAVACFAALIMATAMSGSTKTAVSSASLRVMAAQTNIAPVVLPTPVANPIPVNTPVVAPIGTPAPIATPAEIEIALIAAVQAPAVTEPAPVITEPVPVLEAPPAVEQAPAVEAAPVTPAAVVEAAPVTPAPVVQAAVVAPTTTRSGPAAVVNQLPESAFRWLEANNWTVEWRQGPGPGRQAEAQYATSTIVIWHDNSYSSTTWAGAFAHELGHAVSYVHFNNAQMTEWNTMRGLASWRWVPGTPNDFSVGEGDFAESFMSYLLGHSPRSAGGQLTPAQAAWIAANTPF